MGKDREECSTPEWCELQRAQESRWQMLGACRLGPWSSFPGVFSLSSVLSFSATPPGGVAPLWPSHSSPLLCGRIPCPVLM